MTSYNAQIEFDAPADTVTLPELVGIFEDFHPAAARSAHGHAEVIITLEAETLRQATTVALALVDGTKYRPLAITTMLTEDFDRRSGFEPVPELVSITEAAEVLGVTRSAVQQRIDSGSLPARKVGKTWVVPTSALG